MQAPELRGDAGSGDAGIEQPGPHRGDAFQRMQRLELVAQGQRLRPTPLLQRDPTVPWKLLLGVSALLNLLLLVWLLFLPR